MSRSGYTDDGYDDNNWAMICYRGQLASAIRGRRGQALLRELLDALDAMPVKALIADSLSHNGGYCALGVVGAARGMDLSALDPDDAEQVGAAFNIATPLAREIVYVNDEQGWFNDAPEARWQRVRAWVVANLNPPKVVTP